MPIRCSMQTATTSVWLPFCSADTNVSKSDKFNYKSLFEVGRDPVLWAHFHQFEKESDGGLNSFPAFVCQLITQAVMLLKSLSLRTEPVTNWLQRFPSIYHGNKAAAMHRGTPAVFCWYYLRVIEITL